MKTKKSNKIKKTCPFLDSECQEAGCMLYHEEFERCEIAVLIYNTYCLTNELKKFNPRKD